MAQNKKPKKFDMPLEGLTVALLQTTLAERKGFLEAELLQVNAALAALTVPVVDALDKVIKGLGDSQ